MLIRVDVRALLVASLLLFPAWSAIAQDDVGRPSDDRKAEEDRRRMSEAQRAADRIVDHKSYTSVDVSRAQLGELTPSATPGGKPPGSSGQGQGRTP